MSTDENPDYDLIVVGGGPCGSTVSTLVAMQGHRVLLLEQERFPRYQIGESLLPSTVHGICRLLGVSDEVAAAGFTTKRGGTFRWGREAQPWTFAFSVSEKFAGDGATAYQVERAKFDNILLTNAARKGVEVRQECAVADVLMDGDRVAGVRYTDAAGTHEVRSRFVVDASGHRSRIHGRIGGKRQYSEFFRNIAVFGYFEGGKRLPAPNEGNILAAAFASGWFWYIPLSPTLTSVGAVLTPEALPRVQANREQALLELIQECPLIAEYLVDAQRVTTGIYGEVRVRKDYSYLQERFWRPGMALVGDAACFIDPVFSSGVHLATYGGLLAARSINTSLAGTLDEETCFTEYEARYRREYSVFHDFLVAFYDMEQDQESYFWTARRVTNGSGPGLESFVELVGGGASQEGALLNARSYADGKKAAAFSELAEVVSRPVGSAGEDRNLLGTALARSVAQEGARIQVQAVTGGNLDERTPRRPGGLIPSADGLHWSRPA